MCVCVLTHSGFRALFLGRRGLSDTASLEATQMQSHSGKDTQAVRVNFSICLPLALNGIYPKTMSMPCQSGREWKSGREIFCLDVKVESGVLRLGREAVEGYRPLSTHHAGR